MNKYLRLAKIRIAQGWREVTLHKKAATYGGVMGMVVGMVVPTTITLIACVVASAVVVYWTWKDKKDESGKRDL